MKSQSTDCDEVLEQTAATARCPASFIRFGPQVVGDPGLFLFNSNTRVVAAAATAATATTTTMAMHNAIQRHGPER